MRLAVPESPDEAEGLALRQSQVDRVLNVRSTFGLPRNPSANDFLTRERRSGCGARATTGTVRGRATVTSQERAVGLLLAGSGVGSLEGNAARMVDSRRHAAGTVDGGIGGLFGQSRGVQGARSSVKALSF